jgi:SAM-dependent methyltransferase
MSVLEALQALTTTSPTRTEADVQSDVKALLVAGDFLPGETPLLESQAGDGSGGRIDVELGLLVIECKKVIDPKKKAALAAAEAQLAGYLAIRERQSGHLYSGLLTDGLNWRHYRLSDGKCELVSNFELRVSVTDDRPFRTWLGSVLPTQVKVKPTAATIEGRLGASTPSHEITTARLKELLARGESHPEVQLKRELWAKLLRTAFGTQFEGTDELFIEHTYLVVLATLIARAALNLPAGEPPSVLLSGESFAVQGVTGVGEAGFFDWMLNVDGDEVVTDIERRVACFDWSSTDHDVLKALYQSVLSPEVRHRLGEYYTPDWLADRIVRTTVTDPLTQRILDPACGSGTFLFAAIHNFFEAAATEGWSIQKTVDNVQGHVSGIDLHPVAVALAQVTYLLAVGLDSLEQRSRPFAVPVYLGDSMRWEDSLQGTDELFSSTTDVVVHTNDLAELFPSELRFPGSVVARDDFDSFVGELTEKATDRTPGSAIPNIEGILNKYVSDQAERATLTATFVELCKLHDLKRNHIWGYFVRNQARPAWFAQSANRVDVLVGNPPWLAYRFMPKAMQETFRERSKLRGLWRGGARGHSTQQELAAFFIARSVELYLRPAGSFAFVAPYAVLSRQGYEGFRTGKWNAPHGPQLSAHFGTPWSLRDVRPDPFPVPSAVIVGTKGKNGSYSPLPGVVESLKGKVARTGDWASVGSNIVVSTESISAHSVEGDHGSPYKDRFRSGATLFPRFMVFVEATDHVPFATAQQRSVRSRRSGLEKDPWKSLPDLVGAPEALFIRPVLMGECIVPFGAVHPLEAVIPWTKGTGFLNADDPKIDGFPGFAHWWREAVKVYLANRTTDKRTLLEQLNYMRQLEAQFPIAPIRVVYSASGSTLAAAVITDTNTIIEHGLYWGAVPTIDEARYLCAVLNAPNFTETIRPYQSEGAFGPRHFDKYVWIPPTPLFQATSALHRALVNLAAEAEELVSATPPAESEGFQAHRRRIRDRLISGGIAGRLDEAVAELLNFTQS